MKKKNQGITYDELSDILTNVLGKLEKEDNKYLKQKPKSKKSSFISYSPDHQMDCFQ